MKPILAGLALSLGLSSMATAAPVIICEGTYIASQQMLSGRGYVVQGARGLGAVKIKVLECGAKITITAQGMTIPLTRTSDAVANYTGSFQTPKPLLKFNLTAFTPRTIGGTMDASDGQLTINRVMALMLKSGKPANLDGCFEGASGETPYIKAQTATLETFIALGKTASAGNPAAYIQNIEKIAPRTGASTSYEILLYLDAQGNILPLQTQQDLQAAVCGAPSAKTPKYAFEFSVDQTATGAKVTARVVNIASGKIEESQSATGEIMATAMTNVWRQFKFKIGQLATL